jgi:CheY-like chemotaxis protein
VTSPVLELLGGESAWRAGGPGEYRDPPGGASDRKLTEEEKRRRTVLLVEDDGDVRLALIESLAEEGYGVKAARNGVEAIYVLTHDRVLPDLILLDLQMPVMDGWEFRRRVKKNPAWRDIPIIVYSANTKVRPVEAAMILAKPCSIDQLVQAIQAHIRK